MFQIGECFPESSTQWHSTRRFRNFLALYKLKGPVTILPDTLPSNQGFKDTSHLDQPPTCMNSMLQRRRISKLPCTAYSVRELHDHWCLPPISLLVVVYIGSLMHFT
ncbi:uncharacterized protein LACBIDRAFT_309780 [Laccaria bicolor S238N-H82]|uniref:Predicted protein n=1 Tax=Laccaria bicolor (strain S238N-H82 / ATCC MYA-4686) TaxID=486041 RepID=B0DT23_LACBS|nr:uncharacterized protein LACBIDRAFT_309780 [Laccaria bicolor S238N-H82]EDR02341.1 predicted protein [Laccaria bicolor S238N-H82]|eukprot:XP_001887018.1 predicted protein [Laccaria bicolor S238N-H82]